MRLQAHRADPLRKHHRALRHLAAAGGTVMTAEEITAPLPKVTETTLPEPGVVEAPVRRRSASRRATAAAQLLPVAVPPRKSGGTHRVSDRLPQPPTDAETLRYDGRNQRLLMRVSLASFTVLALSQFTFMLTEPWLLAFAPFIAFTIVYYVLALWVNFGTRDFDMPGHFERKDAWHPEAYPSLDVFLPICREEISVLRNTWRGVFDLMMSYQGDCTVYVLDDGADPEAAHAAREFGFSYLSRPETGENPRGWFKKAGNLRYGFANSHGTYIAVFDADFVPRADLPAHLLPYLEADPKLGIVQSPQYFRTHPGQTRMERGASAVQELFYRLVQVSRDQRNGSICVGSCAVYRREALAANGGATLIGHSEDVHTGFDLRRAGWGIRYVPVPLATGLCPQTADAFFVQQYRWCMGSMDLLRHPRFWQHGMPLRTRACYLSGFFYYAHTAVFTVVTPLIPLTLLLLLPGHVRLVNYMFIAPSLIYNFVVFPAWHRCRYGTEAWMAKLLYGWAHMFAITDLLRRKPMGWRPTGGKSATRANRRLWIGVGAYSGGTSVAWIAAAGYRAATWGVQFAPMFALGAFSLYTTVLAIRARKDPA
ncbi:glycosyltransferase [Actinospica sp. MGRD01-02]|uniref:Glycosyltransferase n=1 Tax=Actinospica acidithermotolerans TaxID=2828514 RepID=A0A941EBZ2_9ACTN|nr:cellulose synthase catalytic subunit [Actinospica acidithermotolerans]MBR7826239.1 glycosyltransferase [Actinospica acidithermotolerans]